MRRSVSVFISATSADLAEARRLAESALLSLGYHPVQQAHFGPDSARILPLLERKIRACDALLHIAGHRYGAEPPPGEHAPRRSYTQHEVDLARRWRKPVFLFLTDDEFASPAGADGKGESPELCELQAAHRARILRGEEGKYETLRDLVQLESLVLRLRVDLASVERRLARRNRQIQTALALVAVVVLGLGVWLWRTAGRVADLATGQEELTDEFSRYRSAARALAAQYTILAGPPGKADDSVLHDAAVAAVAREFNATPAEIATWLRLFSEKVAADPSAGAYDKALAAFAGRRFLDAKEQAGLAAQDFRRQRTAAEDAATKLTAQATALREKEGQAFVLAGDAALAAGRYREAVAALREAHALPDKETRAAAWCESAHLLSRALLLDGQWREAAQLADAASEWQARTSGPDAEATLRSLGHKAAIMTWTGQNEAALALQQRVHAGLEKLHGPEHPAVFSAANNIAATRRQLGDFREAARDFEHILAARERVLGPEDKDTLESTNALAVCLQEDGQPEAALKLHERVLAGRTKLFGPEHPLTLSTMNNKANCCASCGQRDEARRLCRTVLDIRRRTLGPEHPETLISMCNLASHLDEGPEAPETEQLYRDAVRIAQRQLPSDHHVTLLLADNLASFLNGRGRPAEALPLLRQSLETRERVHGPEHPLTLDSVFHLGTCCKDAGTFDDAFALLTRARDSRARVLGPEHEDTLIALNTLANLHLARRELDLAEPLYREALRGFEKLHPPEHPLCLGASVNLASLLYNQKETGEAIAIWRRVLAAMEKTLPAAHPNVVVVTGNLAAALESSAPEEARTLHQRTLAAAPKAFGPEHPETIRLLINFSVFAETSGHADEAADAARRALTAAARLPAQHRLRLRAEKRAQQLQLPPP